MVVVEIFRSSSCEVAASAARACRRPRRCPGRRRHRRAAHRPWPGRSASGRRCPPPPRSSTTWSSRPTTTLSSDSASACFQNNNAGRNSYQHGRRRRGQRERVPERLHLRDVHQDRRRLDGRRPSGTARSAARASGVKVANVLNPGYNYDEPTFALGVSNLREIQWNALGISAQGNGYRERTNWSGEILTDRWIHIANVNDRSPRPRRCTSTARSCATRSTRSAWRRPPAVAHRLHQGQRLARRVGETRIIDHATTPDQWLTQRRYFRRRGRCRRRHRPGDALAHARCSGHLRRLHARRREGVHGGDDRDRDLHRR